MLCQDILSARELILFALFGSLNIKKVSIANYNANRIYNQLMQGNKVTLNIRKTVKKQPKQRVHIKTQKIASRLQSQNKLKYNDQEQKSFDLNIKLRHTSVLNKKQSKRKYEIKIKEKSPQARDSSKQQQKFPEIYNPTISSAKYFDLKKYQNKFKMASTNSVIEKRKADSEYISQKQPKSQHRKTELTSAPKTVKLNEILPLKQMSKIKKIELFKAIRSEFNQLINTTNNLSVRNQDISFKAFIEKGNNGILVREIMKRRWWWHVEEDKSKANLIWTQWFDKSAISNMKNLTICDQTIDVEEYKIKKYEEGNNKSQAIKKLVDDHTFGRLEKRISLHSNTYFKNPKGIMGLTESLKVIGQPQLKFVTVENDQIIHNHVEGCLNLHSKKLLFSNFHKFMLSKLWDPFLFIPLTFYIQSRDSSMINQLLKKYEQFQEQKKLNTQLKNIWICKPGQNSNRGAGIKVVKSRQQILSQIKNRLPQNSNSGRSVIIQKYIQKCFLINNRKFDIRCYILLTTANGILKGYWYKDGYIRTSSIQYNLNDTDNQMIHLTNDAVQKKGEDFGKHEDSNKLSFDYFRTYLRKQGLSPYKFDETYQQMKLIAYYLIASVSTKIKRKQFTFQLFGLDFMLDQNLKPMLIEANSNPCLSNHGKILGKLIHQLVQNVFMTAIDPIFPPPMQHLQRKKMTQQINKDYFETNKFQLIFTGKYRPQNSQEGTQSNQQ